MPVEISLSRGAISLVDAADAERVMACQWQLNCHGPHRYGQTSLLLDGKRRTVILHRFILNALPGTTVDHIDGDGLNNQRSNLRIVSRGQNKSNSIKRREAASSFKGVVQKGMKWGAQISALDRLPSVPWYIGTFDTQVDAARAYDACARILFGEHARVNFPRLGEQGAAPTESEPAAE